MPFLVIRSRILQYQKSYTGMLASPKSFANYAYIDQHTDFTECHTAQVCNLELFVSWILNFFHLTKILPMRSYVEFQYVK